MNCPKCKEVGLRMKEQNYPYSCPKCGGLWIASDSLSKLEELSDQMYKGHKNPEHDFKTGLCPKGHGILTRVKLESEQPFYLEKCSKCNGIWFDKDEWQKISTSQIENNLLNLWSLAWQKQQKSVRKKHEIKKMYEQALGEELYRDIVTLAQQISIHPERYRALTLFNEELEKKKA